MRAWQTALVSLSVAAIVGGCGSSSPSVQSFRQDANRICSQYGRQAEAVTARPGHTARTLEQTSALLARMNRAFRRLTPPPTEKQPFQQFLAVQRESLRELRRIQRFTALNEPKAFSALKRERPRLHVPPAQALQHPTAATLAEAMSIPPVRRYMRGLDALGRASMATGRRGERLTKELGFTACL